MDSETTFLRVAVITKGSGSMELWTCLACGALVAGDARSLHRGWHRSQPGHTTSGE